MTTDIQTASHGILIVDDISKNIQVLGSILRAKGYTLSFATSGPQALEMVTTERFDLILLDIAMPKMDGFEVCRRLKASPDTQSIPIIFLTARTEMDDVVAGLHLGAVDYITKPFNSEELLARVRTHLELKRSRELIEKKNMELEIKQRKLETTNERLIRALTEIKQLRGIIPICSFCKKIRDDKGYWEEVERYIQNHTQAEFSHGICPECMKKHYPDIDEP